MVHHRSPSRTGRLAALRPGRDVLYLTRGRSKGRVPGRRRLHCVEAGTWVFRRRNVPPTSPCNRAGDFLEIRTQAGFGPSTRPLNDILYPHGFRDNMMPQFRRGNASVVSESLCRGQDSVGTVLARTTYIPNCSPLIRVPPLVPGKRLHYVRPTRPVGSRWRPNTQSARPIAGHLARTFGIIVYRYFAAITRRKASFDRSRKIELALDRRSHDD